MIDRTPMPRRATLLTFDDGYANLISTARDMLKPRGIEALAFVLTRPGSNSNDWDTGAGTPERRLIAPAQFDMLAELGIEIGSHARTHRELTRVSAQAMETGMEGWRGGRESEG